MVLGRKQGAGEEEERNLLSCQNLLGREQQVLLEPKWGRGMSKEMDFKPRYPQEEGRGGESVLGEDQGWGDGLRSSQGGPLLLGLHRTEAGGSTSLTAGTCSNTRGRGVITSPGNAVAFKQ